MADLKRKMLVFSLLATFLFINGCATIEKAKKVDDLEKRIDQLSQAIKEKDDQINQLRESLDSQQRQLQESELSYERSLEKLYKELNELRQRQATLEKKEPNLK